MEGEPEFEVSTRETPDGVIVAPRGEIDLVTVDEVRAALERHSAKRIYLDLREVTFIDSAGVRLVVEADRAGELIVVRGPVAVRRLFDLVGLDGRVSMVDAPPGE